MPDLLLKHVLTKLEINQADLARLLDVTPRTVSFWANGSKPLPSAVSAYLRLLDDASPDVRAKELERLDKVEKPFAEGVYRIAYSGTAQGEAEFDQALAVLRNGKILGSDRHGSVFTGSYTFDRRRDATALSLRIGVPPHGMLVNGFAAGEDGAEVEVSCKLRRAVLGTRTTISVAGKPLGVEFTYIGPLPN